MSSFMDTMGEVDAQLANGGGPFFLGQDMSLVDCVFAPFLERINASIPYYKGVQLRGSQQFPHLDRSESLHLCCQQFCCCHVSIIATDRPATLLNNKV